MSFEAIASRDNASNIARPGDKVAPSKTCISLLEQKKYFLCTSLRTFTYVGLWRNRKVFKIIIKYVFNVNIRTLCFN